MYDLMLLTKHVIHVLCTITSNTYVYTTYDTWLMMTYGIFKQSRKDGRLYFGMTKFSCLVRGPSESFINQNFPKLSFYPVEDKEIRVSNKMLFDWGNILSI